MRLLVHSCASPAEDLALEEALHVELEAGASPPTWRLWEARAPAVVLGTGQEHLKEVCLEAARAAGVPVLRRHSGGGAVVIGPGVLNYSGFFRFDELPHSETIRGAMESGLQAIRTALEGWGIASVFAGLSDLAVHGPAGVLCKVAGNSQARKRVSVLVHGTLLANPDWDAIERLLPYPTRPPDYRGKRAHRDFLTSLKERGAPVTLAELAGALARAVPFASTETQPLPAEAARARSLCAEKYSHDAWNLRR